MSGKPTITGATHRKIRKLHSQGVGKKAIAETVGCSLYTVRKALDADFAAREQQRHRDMWPTRKAQRQGDERYVEASANYYVAHRDEVKARVARRRAAK